MYRTFIIITKLLLNTFFLVKQTTIPYILYYSSSFIDLRFLTILSSLISIFFIIFSIFLLFPFPFCFLLFTLSLDHLYSLSSSSGSSVFWFVGNDMAFVVGWDSACDLSKQSAPLLKRCLIIGSHLFWKIKKLYWVQG